MPRHRLFSPAPKLPDTAGTEQILARIDEAQGDTPHPVGSEQAVEDNLFAAFLPDAPSQSSHKEENE